MVHILQEEKKRYYRCQYLWWQYTLTHKMKIIFYTVYKVI